MRLLTGFVLAVVLGPLVVAVGQIVHDPPPEHTVLALIGAVGEALDRLLWSLSAAMVVLAVWWAAARTR